jgi:hypothetical protein
MGRISQSGVDRVGVGGFVVVVVVVKGARAPSHGVGGEQCQQSSNKAVTHVIAGTIYPSVIKA